jgi:hypothetical protein
MLPIVLGFIVACIGFYVFATYGTQGPVARGFLWIIVATLIVGTIISEFKGDSSISSDDLEHAETDYRP